MRGEEGTVRLVVTGSSGLIGSALCPALAARGHEVLRLVRREPDSRDEIRWDPEGGTIDTDRLAGVDGAVHLAGETIGGRLTARKRARILSSRVEGTTLLCATLARLEPRPRVLVSASAIGHYGDRGDEELAEDSPPGEGFLARVTQEWEAATRAAEEAGIRVVHVRSGLVLSGNGGALKPMLLPFRLGVGGRIGSGRQWWSWISIDDEVGAIVHLLEDEDAAGPFNLTAPNPTRNAAFVRTLGWVLRRPTVLPAPAFALKLLLGHPTTEELLLASQRVLPRRLEASGYGFAHTELERALRAALGRKATV